MCLYVHIKEFYCSYATHRITFLPEAIGWQIDNPISNVDIYFRGWSTVSSSPHTQYKPCYSSWWSIRTLWQDFIAKDTAHLGHRIWRNQVSSNQEDLFLHLGQISQYRGYYLGLQGGKKTLWKALPSCEICELW